MDGKSRGEPGSASGRADRRRKVESQAAVDVAVRHWCVDKSTGRHAANVHHLVTDRLVIVSVPEEVPVVVRRLRVVEELHIERRRTTAKRSRTVTLRRQKAIIERVRPLRSSLPEQNNRENPRPRAVRSK